MTCRRDAPDLDDTLYVVRDNLGKADAFITAAEQLIERPGDSDDDDNDDGGRHWNHVAQLVESTKLAVRAAIYAGGQMAARIDKHRMESAPAPATVVAVNLKHRVRR